MKTKVCIWGTVLVFVFLMGCGGPTLPEKFEVALKPAKGYEGAATGKVVINTKTGTDIAIDISGLKPDGLYTAFFVNIKSKMFEGVGNEPFIIPVDASGTVSFQGNMKKNSFKRFTKIGIYLNPGDTPVHNPLGVKAKLGALMKSKKAKMVLEGKLR